MFYSAWQSTGTEYHKYKLPEVVFISRLITQKYLFMPRCVLSHQFMWCVCVRVFVWVCRCERMCMHVLVHASENLFFTHFVLSSSTVPLTALPYLSTITELLLSLIRSDVPEMTWLINAGIQRPTTGSVNVI